MELPATLELGQLITWLQVIIPALISAGMALLVCLINNARQTRLSKRMLYIKRLQEIRSLLAQIRDESGSFLTFALSEPLLSEEDWGRDFNSRCRTIFDLDRTLLFYVRDNNKAMKAEITRLGHDVYHLDEINLIHQNILSLKSPIKDTSEVSDSESFSGNDFAKTFIATMEICESVIEQICCDISSINFSGKVANNHHKQSDYCC